MPGSEDEEEGDDGAAVQQIHRFVRGVAPANAPNKQVCQLRRGTVVALLDAFLLVLPLGTD